MEGVVTLERLTLTSPPLEGVVLRYGQIYGPGTEQRRAGRSAPLHVDAAAHAALLAIKVPNRGFSISPRTPATSQSQRHAASLGGDPGFRLRNGEAAGVLSATTHRSQSV